MRMKKDLTNLLASSSRSERLRALAQVAPEESEFPDKYKQDTFKIGKCFNTAWIALDSVKEGKFTFYAYSDSKILGGILTVLLSVLNGKTAQDIRNFDLEDFCAKIHLEEYLSSMRGVSISDAYLKITDLIMNMEDRIEELEFLIKKHRKAYYNGQPEIEDDEFDALEDELRKLDPDNEVLKDVGASPPEKTKWQKKAHVIPMGSLNKANSMDEMKDWFKKSRPSMLREAGTDSDVLFWSEKMDGISIALQYVDGKLVSALTRGDGQVGEDIIANAVLMRGVPRNLKAPSKSKKINGTFRGEIVLTHDWHKRHFSDYSNPRNAASGLARVEDRQKAKRCQYLSVYIYEAYVDGYEFNNQLEKFYFLDSLGLMLPNNGGPTSLENIGEIYQAYEDHHRDELFYDIDGLVVRYHAQRAYDLAGERNHRPYGSVALKFEAETAITTLNDVRWQVGNTGRITPVAEFDTVELAGAEVSKASLYNVSYIQDLGLGIGDEVLVKRANDVIPRVERVVSQKSSESILQGPDVCPECKSPTTMDGEHLLCTGRLCPAKVSGNIKAWVDKLDLLDWGEFVIDALVEEGKVKTIPDLYELEVSDIAELKNSGGAVVGEKTAKKLLRKLDSKKEVPLDIFIGGLNIPMSRDRTIRLLMKAGYDSLEALLEASPQDLEEVQGMGDKKASALSEGLEERRDIIEHLLSCVEISTRQGALKGKSFCLTGKMSKSRKVIEKMIKDQGGEVKKGVSKSLSYLVCNDKDSTSSKAKKAVKYGIPMIEESELYKMIETQ